MHTIKQPLNNNSFGLQMGEARIQAFSLQVWRPMACYKTLTHPGHPNSSYSSTLSLYMN